MKSATSTLHAQLDSIYGVSMSSPKEPCYFSDDNVYELGEKWYRDCFNQPHSGLRGESSTHYTKLPTYPNTVPRMIESGLKETKFIYIIRHPIDRLVSQYIHEWSQNKISIDINRAIYEHPYLVQYSRYFYQLTPYLERYSKQQIKLVFFENLKIDPNDVLAEICQFIGVRHNSVWNDEASRENVSSQRIRSFPLKKLLVDNSFMATFRRALVPRFIRDKIKTHYQMDTRPTLSNESLAYLSGVFDLDLRQLGNHFGLALDVENYYRVVAN